MELGTSTPGHEGGTRGVPAGHSWPMSEVGATFSLTFLEVKVVKKLPGGWKNSKPALKGVGRRGKYNQKGKHEIKAGEPQQLL